MSSSETSGAKQTRHQDVAHILATLRESGWEDATVAIGDDIKIATSSRRAATAAPRVASTETSVGRASPPDASRSASRVGAPRVPSPTARNSATSERTVTSPTVGTVHAVSAGQLPHPGDRVERGQPLCAIDVAGRLRAIDAVVAGRVTVVHVANDDFVEFGQPLFTISTS